MKLLPTSDQLSVKLMLLVSKQMLPPAYRPDSLHLSRGQLAKYSAIERFPQVLLSPYARSVSHNSRFRSADTSSVEKSGSLLASYFVLTTALP